MNRIIFNFLFAFSIALKAQVGINTENPKGILDVQNQTNQNSGIVLPTVVDETSITTVNGEPIPDGMLAYDQNTGNFLFRSKGKWIRMNVDASGTGTVSGDALTPQQITDANNARLKTAVTETNLKSMYITGRVVNQSGSPLSDVKVSFTNYSPYSYSQAPSTTTDAEGFFNFIGEYWVKEKFQGLKAEHTTNINYLDVIKTIEPEANQLNIVNIVLPDKPNPVVLNSNAGGVVAHNGATINFPANSFVNQDGTPYNGNVNVVTYFYNPSQPQFPYEMPGRLVGLDDSNELVSIISGGMIRVDITDNAGNKINVSPTEQIKITAPYIPGTDPSIPLWHLDEEYGVWVKTGHAQKVGSDYVGYVNHFSTINWDWVYGCTYGFVLALKDTNGNPMPGYNVKIQDALQPEFTYETGVTDALGVARIPRVQCNRDIKVFVYDGETLLYEQVHNPITSGNLAISLNNADFNVNLIHLTGDILNSEDATQNLGTYGSLVKINVYNAVDNSLINVVYLSVSNGNYNAYLRVPQNITNLTFLASTLIQPPSSVILTRGEEQVNATSPLATPCMWEFDSSLTNTALTNNQAVNNITRNLYFKKSTTCN